MAAFALVVLATMMPKSVVAQTYSIAPLAWAVPIDQRPAELQAAQDFVVNGGQQVRLSAEVWVVVDACPKKKSRETCLVKTETQGRLAVDSVWYNQKAAGVELEQIWLLHKGGVWSTKKLTKTADGGFAFGEAPPLPGQTAVDVIVKIRDAPDLLQTRYRTMYQRARGS